MKNIIRKAQKTDTDQILELSRMWENEGITFRRCSEYAGGNTVSYRWILLCQFH
jgi:N-acetylglutamate synthase-like GNAT family acetyltransferase